MAGARPDTWMPLYIGDYLADTMHLSHAQHGIYFLLIMAYWRNGGPLPDDADELSAIAKCSASEWRKNLRVISRFFHIEDGAWSHKRIDAELGGAVAKTQERSKSGAEGARRRWQTDGKPIAEPLANGMAEPLANAWQNDAPLPKESKKDSVGLRNPTGAESAPFDVKKEIYTLGKAVLGQSAGGVVSKLINYHDGDLTAALYTLRQAETAAFPKEYLGKIIAGEANTPTDWDEHPAYRGLL